jgi:hypothetical protein
MPVKGLVWPRANLSKMAAAPQNRVVRKIKIMRFMPDAPERFFFLPLRNIFSPLAS